MELRVTPGGGLILDQEGGDPYQTLPLHRTSNHQISLSSTPVLRNPQFQQSGCRSVRAWCPRMDLELFDDGVLRLEIEADRKPPSARTFRCKRTGSIWIGRLYQRPAQNDNKLGGFNPFLTTELKVISSLCSPAAGTPRLSRRMVNSDSSAPHQMVAAAATPLPASQLLSTCSGGHILIPAYSGTSATIDTVPNSCAAGCASEGSRARQWRRW
ncbi:hypothetical protein EV426DRAFT_719831 [Tirmania nivea]|nr:hypothetical protein EV426DRAFT_719831 [Tirmania nivea]